MLFRSVLRSYAQSKISGQAQSLAAVLSARTVASEDSLPRLREEFSRLLQPDGVDYLAVLDSTGAVLMERKFDAEFPALSAFPEKDLSQTLKLSPKLFELNDSSFALAGSPLAISRGRSGTLIVGDSLPKSVSESAARLDQESITYENLSRERKFLRRTYISILLLLTVVILFIATWFALFLSRQITVPMQALAEATHEVSRGNLDHRVNTKAADELGILVRSFNEMTSQLAASRSELETSRNHLEEMNVQLDHRRRFTETILESIPTGVISLTSEGTILASNPAANRLFGLDLRAVGALSSLFGPDEMREFESLRKRAGRTGQATRQMDVRRGDRHLNLAITVSALSAGPPGSAGAGQGTRWYVAVLEDLSDLLRAQKAAAWGEVAQRIAHEIKNPLTPIALSAQRIHLWLDRQPRANGGSPELGRVVQESCELIQQEVETLKRLVDEFSQFSRFPKAQPLPANLNQIIESSLSLFNGRLDGITVRTDLAPELPQIEADAGQLRRVFVNLIDNATEAMEHSAVRELVITTRADARREIVEATVGDTGHGVSHEDKDSLFLPYFSTKERGTGLGLAIVSRIVAEHEGAIRVEDNRPIGARFIIELPILTTGMNDQ